VSTRSTARVSGPSRRRRRARVHAASERRHRGGAGDRRAAGPCPARARLVLDGEAVALRPDGRRSRSR
jgi:hypothetical protein